MIRVLRYDTSVMIQYAPSAERINIRQREVFTDPQDEHNFTEKIRRLTHGKVLMATAEITPPAYNLQIKSPNSEVPKLAFLYDVAGEAFNEEDNMHKQLYYPYTQGIIFIGTIPLTGGKKVTLAHFSGGGLGDEKRAKVISKGILFERIVNESSSSLFCAESIQV